MVTAGNVRCRAATAHFMKDAAGTVRERIGQTASPRSGQVHEKLGAGCGRAESLLQLPPTVPVGRRVAVQAVVLQEPCDLFPYSMASVQRLVVTSVRMAFVSLLGSCSCRATKSLLQRKA